MKIKYIKCVLICLIALTLGGCSVDLNRTDISSSLIAQAAGVDFDAASGEYTFYILYSQNDQSSMAKGSGKTVADAYDSLFSQTKKYPLLTQTGYFVISKELMTHGVYDLKAFLSAQGNLRFDSLVFSADDVDSIFEDEKLYSVFLSEDIRHYLQKKVKRLSNTLGDFLSQDSIYLFNLSQKEDSIYPDTLVYLQNQKLLESFDESLTLSVLLRLDNLLAKTLEYQSAILEIYNISYSPDKLCFEVNVYPKARGDNKTVLENASRHCEEYFLFLLSLTGKKDDIKLSPRLNLIIN